MDFKLCRGKRDASGSVLKLTASFADENVRESRFIVCIVIAVGGRCIVVDVLVEGELLRLALLAFVASNAAFSPSRQGCGAIINIRSFLDVIIICGALIVSIQLSI